MPAPQDLSGQKSRPPIRRVQCRQCRSMNMQDVFLCVVCGFVLRRT